MTLTLLLVALGVIAFLLGALTNAKADQRRMDRLIRDLSFQVQPDLSPEELQRELSEAEANRVQLNPEGFLSCLNDDMRKPIQREEIEAKIEAYRNSSSTAPLHEYIGISEAELYAFLEQDEASGIVEKLPDKDRTHPSEPA